MKGFADYFLVVNDIVEHGPTHCGRGSVANSIVSYCLGITHVEPLGAGLLFERFLNPERKDPPDIDLDFPWDERDKVLAYVFRHYPRPQAAMVANHNCFRLRGALREVAKVHGRPAGEIREVTRRIPDLRGRCRWRRCSPRTPTSASSICRRAGASSPAWRSRWWACRGISRSIPAASSSCPTALTDYVPIEPAVKTLDGHPDLTVPVIQFEKDGAEDAGLVKIDLLGNRSLAVIRDAIAAVRDHTGRQIDYTSSDAGEDEPTKALFRTGQTMGVFYTESPASRQLCAKSRAETFELLVLNTSIIRPGLQPVHPHLSRAAARRALRAARPGAARHAGRDLRRDGLSGGRGQRLRRLRGHAARHRRRPAQVALQEAPRQGSSPATPRSSSAAPWRSAAIPRRPSGSGRWSCRSRATASARGTRRSYIQVAQHSCYLRAHYPAEFMAAVLANGGGFYHPFAYVAEAMRMGLTVLPPDINASEFRCTGRDGEVRIGLQFVKGLSAEGAERVLRARDSRGSVSSRAERGSLRGYGNASARSSVASLPRDDNRQRNAPSPASSTSSTAPASLPTISAR